MSASGVPSVPGEPRPRVVLVVAHDGNRAIGRGNALPWHLPNDLRRFKALTLGRPILPGRRNLVLTRSGQTPLTGMEAVASLDEALAVACADGAESLCVIGGGELYALALPRAHVLQVTRIDTEVSGADTFFPRLDVGDWTPVFQEAHGIDARHAHAYTFIEYRRTNAG